MRNGCVECDNKPMNGALLCKECHDETIRVHYDHYTHLYVEEGGGGVTCRRWGTGNNIGQTYRLTERDLTKVGHSWMEGRLKVDDLVVCSTHSGDCFYDYILVKEYANGLRGIPESKFGAYAFGNEDSVELTAREFHLLMAGEFVERGELT